MRFKKIYIEITNQCNLKCSFCIQNKRKSKFMTLNEFSYILDEIQPYTKYIYLHVLGEPLLHPQLDKILKLAKEKEFFVNITTNGTLLLKNKDILLSDHSIRQINVSLHSFPMIPSYLNDVTNICDMLSNNGIYISYRLWTFDGDLSSEMKNTIEYLQDRYNLSINNFINSIKLKDHCFLSFDSTFKWPSIENEFVSDYGSCHGFKHMCGILSDGRVVPCCLDSNGDATLGNIFDTNFKDILENNMNLLNDFQNHKMTLELCKKCTYRLRFDHK